MIKNDNKRDKIIRLCSTISTFHCVIILFFLQATSQASKRRVKRLAGFPVMTYVMTRLFLKTDWYMTSPKSFGVFSTGLDYTIDGSLYIGHV